MLVAAETDRIKSATNIKESTAVNTIDISLFLLRSSEFKGLFLCSTGANKTIETIRIVSVIIAGILLYSSGISLTHKTVSAYIADVIR